MPIAVPIVVAIVVAVVAPIVVAIREAVVAGIVVAFGVAIFLAIGMPGEIVRRFVSNGCGGDVVASTAAAKNAQQVVQLRGNGFRVGVGATGDGVASGKRRLSFREPNSIARRVQASRGDEVERHLPGNAGMDHTGPGQAW